MESSEIAKLFDALCQEPRGFCNYFEMSLKTFTSISLIDKYKFRLYGKDIEARSFMQEPRYGNIIYNKFKCKKNYLGSIWFSHGTYFNANLKQATDIDTGFIVFEDKYLSDGKVILRRL